MKHTVFSRVFSLWGLMAFVLSLSFVGCSDEDEILAPVLKIVSQNHMVSQAGGEATIAFTVENPTRNGAADARTAADWVTSIDAQVNGGEGRVLLQVAANEAEAERQAEITLSYPNANDLTFRILQPGKNQAVLQLDKSSLEVPAQGGRCEVALTVANPSEGAEVTARSEAAWLHAFVYDAAAGKFCFETQANEEAATRCAQIVLSYPLAEDVVLTVTQQAADEVALFKFTHVAVSVYQKLESGLTNYYLVLTTCPFTIDNDSQVILSEPGYLMAVDLYADAQEQGVLPQGAYRAASGTGLADMTYNTDYTTVIYQDGHGGQRPYAITADFVVELENGEYYLHSAFNNRGENCAAEYRGPLKLQDVSGSQGGSLPSIGHDVVVEAVQAKGIYYGNMLQSESGLTTINLMDQTYTDDETKGQGGYAVSLSVFTQLFPQTNLIRLIPGTYQVGTDFKKSSWMPGVEINAMGSIMPFGTYAHCDNDSGMGSFLYANAGTITIEAVESGYRITYDLTSQDGYKISGSYEGYIEIIDQSNDESRDDGTSTLTDDHDMDLSAIRTARLFSLGDVEDAKGNVHTHSRIDIGSRGGWDMEDVLKSGDTFTMDLVMAHDEAGRLVPGTYKVTTDHFPASMTPGAAVRGYIWSGEYMGTGWLGFDTNKTNDLYLNGHAAAYGGEVVIEKSDLGENYYTFTIDVVCVRKMHIRGTWTGPVVNAGDGSPVLPGQQAAPAPVLHTICPWADVQLVGSMLSADRSALRVPFRKIEL